MTDTVQSFSTAQKWLLASRPKTLPAAAAPVVVGSAAAFYDGVFALLPALAALLGALLLQIGSNLANDVFDYKKGADTSERLGPMRVTQAGLLSPQAVMLGMWVTFGLAALVGLYLIYVGGWPIILIGVFSILAAIAYTGGPFPLGYNGLGDIFVFIFFGLVAVIGTYYVQAGAISPLAIGAAIPVGFLVTAILVVNNLRDIDTDRKAGKRTLAVRLGRRGTQVEYAVLVGGAYLLPLLLWLTQLGPVWMLLAWLSAALLPGLFKLILHEQGRILNKALAGTAQLSLVFSLCFALGLVIGG